MPISEPCSLDELLRRIQSPDVIFRWRRRYLDQAWKDITHVCCRLGINREDAYDVIRSLNHEDPCIESSPPRKEDDFAHKWIFWKEYKNKQSGQIVALYIKLSSVAENQIYIESFHENEGRYSAAEVLDYRRQKHSQSDNSI